MVARKYVAAGLLAAALLGCGNGGRDDGEPVPQAPAVPERRVLSLADGETLAILDALHEGAAGYAAVAVDSVMDAELRRLLRVMRTDHQALRAELGAIADSLGLQPDVHQVADQVRRTAQDATDAVSGAAGGGSDGSVLQRQIEFQESLLGVLDSTVIPGTRQPLLAQFIAAARPTLGAHLQRAHQIEALLRERAAAAPVPTAVARPATPAPAEPEPTATPTREPEPTREPVPRPAEPDTQPAPADPDTTGIGGRALGRS